jgi:H+-transporting ATPase
VAVIIEIIRAAIAKEDYEGFVVLLILQFANAIIGFIEESNAGDAIAALKAKLAPQCHVCRDGKWATMVARQLVPGDLIELKIGDVVPADSILRVCKPVQVDQAALTGESLPVIKTSWGKLLMGSAIKQGECHAVVIATGPNTFFGRTAGLIGSVVTHGRLQMVLLRITATLLVLSLVLCVIIFAVLYSEPVNPRALDNAEAIDPKYNRQVRCVIGFHALINL